MEYRKLPHGDEQIILISALFIVWMRIRIWLFGYEAF